jgi:parvulin-like peptidyl-prolyl isomerase
VLSDEVYDFLLQTPPSTFQTNITDAGFFTDEDGKFDLLTYQDAVRSGNIPSELENLLVLWENYLKTWLADRKLRNMYSSLASITDEEILDDYYKKNINANINYIYINPNDIPDSLISIPEQELLDEYNKVKEETYKVDNTVDVSYVIYSFPKQNEDSLIYTIEKDSIMNQAFLFSDEAKYSSFSEAMNVYNLSVDDTLTLSQALSGNSGIPFTMGNSRKVIRFAFDSDLGSISEPVEMKNGIAVFHIISQNPSTYKAFDDVKENIKRTFLKDLKENKAKEIISNAMNSSNNWKSLSDSNEYINYLSDQTSTLAGSFTSIGRSSQLEGTLFSINNGQTSKLIKTASSFLYLKLNSKDEFDEADFNEKIDAIRAQLLSAKKNRGYFDWLNSAKSNIEIDDWRYLIY